MILGLVLVVAAVVGASSATAAGTAPPQSSPKAPDRLSAPLTATSNSDCSTVRSHLSELAAAGKRRVVCFEPPSGTRAGLVTSAQSGPTPYAPYSNPQANCAGLQLNTWWYAREWFCFIDFGDTVPTVDTTTGNTVGQAVYTITHAAGFDPHSGTWSNFASFYIQSEWGDSANIVDSFNRCSGCSGISAGDPISGPVTAPLQQAVAGTNNLSDSPFNNTIDASIYVSWADSFNCGDCISPGTRNYAFPEPVRCDAQANTGVSPGCSIPAFTPTLQLTGYATGNTSTAFVSYFQANNVDHWGLYPSGTPLTRLNNPAQAQANRDVICARFVPNPQVPSDSCDEFPFAATYQSGRMLGLTASDCSQILPQFNSATTSWQFTTYSGYSTSQRCGIGHVTLSDNQSVGGMYSTFIQGNRLLDGDPFWLAIV